MNQVCIGIVVLLSAFLMGQDSAAQTGLCDPDPCQSIPNAVADTCTEVGGSCTAPSDFFCSCVAGYTWQGATHTCEDMARIPAGCFDMGDSSDGCAYPDLCPVHNVCISAFEMDIHEVTNAGYAECVGAGGCTAPEYTHSYSRSTYYGNPTYDDFPVIWVGWYQAKAYCTWAGKRLPTEAEWEYAARGGLVGKRYPWGNTISGTDANYYNSGDPWDNDTSRVGYYAPNGYGLYDVAGNVWEWVEDDYHDSYVGLPADGSAWVDNPRGPLRVVRGASWFESPFYLRVAIRYINLPQDIAADLSLGFRCAR